MFVYNMPVSNYNHSFIFKAVKRPIRFIYQLLKSFYYVANHCSIWNNSQLLLKLFSVAKLVAITLSELSNN